MDHRYGRHGPRAWLKWRERHSVPPGGETSPAQSTRTTVYVYDLSSTERIIYIVTTSPQDFEDENEELSENPSFTRSPLSLPSGEKVIELSPGDSALVNAAQIQAFNDVEDLQEISERKFIRINRDGVRGRARKLARSSITGNHTFDEHKRLVALYQRAYEDHLFAEVENNPEIQYISDTREAQLREIAIRDKSEAQPQRDYHIRDLAVIRVLQVTSTPLDAATNHLSRLHYLADRYQEYYSNPREEVEWPADNFRS